MVLKLYSCLAGAAGGLLWLAPFASALAQGPAIVTISPAANARAVPRNASVVATFSQPLTAASAGALKVFSRQRGGLRGGGLAAVAGNTLTFAPTAYDFRPGETVQYTVTTAVAGAGGAGGALGPARVGQFTTAARVSAGQFGTGADPSVDTQPFSSALGDIDADGDLDLVVANGMSGQVSIRSNNGRGTFSGSQALTVGGSPGGDVALADVDGDGDLDLLKADQGMGFFGGTVYVRLNNGLGTFSGSQSVTVGRGPVVLAIGDVDGDGDLDFAVTSSSTSSISIRLNDGAGNFSGSQSVAVGTTPWSVALADLDHDGDLDLVATNYGDNTVSVRLNDGSGVFSGFQDLATGTSPISLTLGDVDGDGDADLLVPNYGSNTVDLRLNNGTGTFGSAQTVAVGSAPGDISLGDVDADGDLDFVVTNFNAGTASVRLNGGTGPLATAPGTAPAVLAAYPNPATGRVTLALPPAATRAELLDALGRVVRSVPAQAGAATLDVAGLAPGLYVVRAAGQVVHIQVE
ncbi:FG-GAP-like repeat-containing protein [Hymenobacter terricola]|uniref:FG-GAP-like repeat-containing protein n=1 Tax=Hymenobacter terricola TaxID=2819236 RepID=UPI001B3103EC|nr:FG-GAP-like repeat-containing protein [Hymenobacter terricola]